VFIQESLLPERIVLITRSVCLQRLEAERIVVIAVLPLVSKTPTAPSLPENVLSMTKLVPGTTRCDIEGAVVIRGAGDGYYVAYYRITAGTSIGD